MDMIEQSRNDCHLAGFNGIACSRAAYEGRIMDGENADDKATEAKG